MQSYFDELDARFPDGFDPGDHHDDEPMAPGAGAFVVATSDGEPVACGGVQEIAPGVGEIKRMWVDPGWRGAGLGSRLLRHLEQVRVDLGDAVVRLDTNGTLVEAIAMYERAGYRRIERYNDNPYAEVFFEKDAHCLRGVSRSQSSSTGTSRASAQAGSWSTWCGDRGSPEAPIGTTQPPRRGRRGPRRSGRRSRGRPRR